MKKKLALLFALIGWFAVIAQYFLMVENRVASITETTIRFFSFFTILTNTLVAVYFTLVALDKTKTYPRIAKPGLLTSITIYITMVGLVYQVALRQIWQPEGLQMVVNEILHSVTPILVIVYWYLYESIKPIKYAQIFNWAAYPLVYLVYILIRGKFSGFYPYPFVDVNTLELNQVLINAVVLIVLFIFISFCFLFVGKSLLKK